MRSNAKCLVFFLFISTVVVKWTNGSNEESFAQHVNDKCSFTRYPSSCKATLLAKRGLGLVHTHTDLVTTFIEKIMHDINLPPMTLYNGRFGISSQEKLETIGYCNELMQLSLKRLNQSLKALSDSPPKNKYDIQSWLSAVLTFQDACRDSITNKATAGSFANQISSHMDHLSILTSNALAFANRIAHNNNHQNKNVIRRRTLEFDIPKWISSKGRKLLQATEIQADVVVAQDGSGNYLTVSEALECAPGNRWYVIYVMAGVYKEKLNVKKDYIMLVGDGKDETIITHSSSVGRGSTMPGSATIAVTGDFFIAREIGFENSAGPDAGQALALGIASDRAALYRCSFRGYQDTLYALALRQFYRECDIYGTIDFIFGNAAAIFQTCNLILRKPSSGSYNVIAANGRSDPGQATGFVVQNCRIAAGSDLLPHKNSIDSYLGRPWKRYSRVVIMQSDIDDLIRPRGWVEWSGGFALKSLYFAEYLNVGPGSETSERVQWPGHHLIGSTEATKFTVAEFIYGNSWLPSTRIIYDAGL